MTTTRWTLLGVAVAVAAVVAFVAFDGEGEGSAERVSLGRDAAPVIDQYAVVEPGTYRVDAVGTPFTFTIDQPMFVPRNGLGWFVLAATDSQGPDDRDIVITRLSVLSDPTQPDVSMGDLDEGWPAEDFAGWLDGLTDEVVVSNREEVMLGGLDATRVELELGETDCGPRRGFCVAFGTNHLITGKDLHPDAKYRIWVVDQGDEDALAVIVGINRESDVEWFDTAEALLSTLVFGEVAPNPLVDAPVGEIELPFLGGIRTELAHEAIVMSDPRGFGRIAIDDQPGETEFLANPFDADGDPLETSGDLVAALESGDAAVIEIESTQIGGLEALAFDIGGSSSAPVLKLRPDIDDGWRLPPRGRMWLIDHPERGLLMITAEAFDDVDTVFPQVLAQTEPIIETLEFVELG